MNQIVLSWSDVVDVDPAIKGAAEPTAIAAGVWAVATASGSRMDFGRFDQLIASPKNWIAVFIDGLDMQLGGTGKLHDNT